jgi:hypothetical protein
MMEKVNKERKAVTAKSRYGPGTKHFRAGRERKK